MLNKVLGFLIAALVLAACETPGTNPDGQRVYWVRKADAGTVQFRMLDSVNALRAAVGAAPVALNAELTASAATHARDMSVQNRPWHFGSDGSSPLDRAARAGFAGVFLGETISETYETEIETLAAWMDREDTRDVILDKRVTHIGFSWFQEKSGKLWWVMTLGNQA
jgi:uncharacterized protein YkwD